METLTVICSEYQAQGSVTGCGKTVMRPNSLCWHKILYIQFYINSSYRLVCPSKAHQLLCMLNSTTAYRNHNNKSLCISTMYRLFSQQREPPQLPGWMVLPHDVLHKHHVVCMKIKLDFQDRDGIMIKENALYIG